MADEWTKDADGKEYTHAHLRVLLLRDEVESIMLALKWGKDRVKKRMKLCLAKRPELLAGDAWIISGEKGKELCLGQPSEESGTVVRIAQSHLEL